jgi:precorrin-6B methylase 2
MHMPKKWTAEEILNTVRAFQPACVISAAADLDVFTALKNKPLTAHSLSASLKTDPRATTIMLDALTALGLLIKKGNFYSVPTEVAEILTEASPKNILPGIRHLANCHRRWIQLAEVVKYGRPAERKPSIRGKAADTASFIGAMEKFSGPIAEEILHKRLSLKLQPLSFTHLLDIGAGSGTWAIAFLRINPQAKATLFDLPDVIPLTRKHLADANLTHRVSFVQGDYNHDDLPEGADLAWLSAVTHQNSREANRALFTKIYNALADKGSLVIRDVVMAPSQTTPVAGALFAINMLVSTESGGTFTFEEFEQDLSAAGFTNIELIHHDEAMNSLIHAEKSR